MKHLWLLITITMVLLGINKQLDLQTLLIQAVRDRAYAHGWYNDRRRYQVDFILVISAAAVVFGIGLSLRLRRVLRRVIVAVAGLGMLVVFVLIRASSFHYVDRALSMGGRFRVNAIVELSGIGLIIGAALQWQVAEQRLLAEPDVQHHAEQRVQRALVDDCLSCEPCEFCQDCRRQCSLPPTSVALGSSSCQGRDDR